MKKFALFFTISFIVLSLGVAGAAEKKIKIAEQAKKDLYSEMIQKNAHQFAEAYLAALKAKESTAYISALEY